MNQRKLMKNLLAFSKEKELDFINLSVTKEK